MPRIRLSMRKIREILRLKYEMELSNRQIGIAVNTSATSIGRVLKRAKIAGLTWPVDSSLDDYFLDQVLFGNDRTRRPKEMEPDYSYMNKELKKKHVTLQLLWDEYRESHPNGYGYSSFCNKYRKWLGNIDLVMRQHHKAGEKLFVDFAGSTVPIYCPEFGTVLFKAQIFVAALGASGYTFAHAVKSQKKGDWIRCHNKAFEFFGGVTELLVPDNLKSAVTKACRYDPDINPAYFQMAKHYKTAILPARV